MLPRQKTTLKEKYAPIDKDTDTNYNWFNQTADHLISQFSYDDQTEEISTIQNAVEGIIDIKEYSYLLNPFNMTSDGDYKIGARLRNHNVLKGVAYLFLGEYARRTHSFVVTAQSSEDENKYKEGLRKQMRDYYEQESINQLNAAGIPTGQPSVEQGTPQQTEEQYRASFDAERAMFGQRAIDYFRNNQDVEAKTIEAYYDWITVGRAYTYKCIRGEDVEYEYVPVKELYVPNESHSLFAEDSSFVVRRRILPLAKILDYYGDELNDDDIDKLEAEYYTHANFFMGSRNVKTGTRGFMRLPTLRADCGDQVITEEQFEGIPVYHTQWRSFEKYGILTYLDELGMPQTIEVDDTYVLDKELGDISIDWKWDICICENTRIGDDIHCLDRIVEESRGKRVGRGNKKLLYNGIKQRSKSGSIQSPIKEGLPYQLLINGLHYQVEKVINKNKGKVMVIPYGLIPRKKGMSTKETMYHVDATSVLWIDETAPNASYAAQMIKTLDMELGSYIKDTYELIGAIKREYWDAIGMNAQRYSDISQGSGKAVTEQAITRSAIITYDLNRQMDKLTEKDYQGALDLSKIAWVRGKKAKYILSDGSQALLELLEQDALYHAESEYNVFVKDSTELSEGLQMVKSVIPQLAQQGGQTEAIFEIATNNNIEKLKDIIARIEANNKKHALQLDAQRGEQQKEIEQITADREKAKGDVEKYKADKQYDAAVDSAAIRSEGNSRNEPRPANDVERMVAAHGMAKDDIKELQREKELGQRDTELALKNKQLDIQKSKANGKQ